MALGWFDVLNLGGMLGEDPTRRERRREARDARIDPNDFGLGTRGGVTGNTGRGSNIIIPPKQWTYADLLRNDGEFQNYNGNPYMVWDQYNSNMNNYQQAQLDQLNRPAQGAGGFPVPPHADPVVGGMGGGQGLGAQRRRDGGANPAFSGMSGAIPEFLQQRQDAMGRNGGMRGGGTGLGAQRRRANGGGLSGGLGGK